MSWTFGQYLRHLVALEPEERRRGRIERNQRASVLPGRRRSTASACRPRWRRCSRRSARVTSSSAGRTCCSSARLADKGFSVTGADPCEKKQGRWIVLGDDHFGAQQQLSDESRVLLKAHFGQRERDADLKRC